MNLQSLKAKKREGGFTIVELLIVVVIIGILAAIVIVAYNGVTNRAKTSKSDSTASSLVKKIEAYQAETGSYPATYSVLTGAASSTSYYIPAASYTLKTTAVVSTDTETTFNYSTCATAGKRITVWDYAAGAVKNYDIGGCSGAVTLVTS